MIAFILKVSLCWLFFYGIYELFLKNKTFFNANRSYLLITLVAGIILPLLEFIPWKNDSNVAHVIYPMLMEIDDLQAVVASRAPEKFDWSMILYVIYGVGFTLSMFRFSIGLQKIMKLFSSSTKLKNDGYTLVMTEEQHLPFSFFKWVFFSKTMTLSEEVDRILTHEIEHIKGRHSFDVLATELLKVVFWCSPMIYLYRNALKEVHEYLADHVVVKSTDKLSYKKLLLAQTNNGLQMALTHQFFNSHLKNRLKMISQKRSGRPTLVMYALGIPVLLLLMFAFTYAIQTEPEEVQDASYESVMPDEAFEFVKYADETDQSKMPYIQVNGEDIDYPLSDHIEIDGKIGSICTYVPAYAQSTYGEKAKLGYINLQDPTFKKENWNPSIAKRIYARFQAKKDTVPNSKDNIDWDKAEIFKVVEQMPRFPGCEDTADDSNAKEQCAKEKMLEYIYETLYYPKEAKDAGKEGMSVTQFVINSKGEIKNAKIVRSIGFGTDEAVLAVVENMNNLEQKWTPGFQRSKAVNVLYTLPVRFKLSDEKEEDAKVENSVGEITEIFKVVEEMPRFPGCEDMDASAKEKEECAKEKMLEFIYSNLRFPKEAREEGIQGMAVVQFVVSNKGEIVNTKILRDPGSGTGESALAVVKKMNDMNFRWTPGYQRGKAVNVQYTLPVRFKLQADEREEEDKNLKVERHSAKGVVISDNSKGFDVKGPDFKIALAFSPTISTPAIFINDEMWFGKLSDIDLDKMQYFEYTHPRPTFQPSGKKTPPVFNFTTKDALNVTALKLEKKTSDEEPQSTSMIFNDEEVETTVFIVDGKVATKNEQNYPKEDEIATINVYKSAAIVYEKFGFRNVEAVMEITTKKHAENAITLRSQVKDIDGTYIQPLFVIDGKVTEAFTREKINPDDIATINVLKGDAAERKYGDKGLNGVVEIGTKEGAKVVSVKDFDTPAYFPGCTTEKDPNKKNDCSQQNLLQYIYSTVKYPKEAREKGIDGMIVTKFIISAEGKISEIKIIRAVDGLTKAAKEAVSKMADEIVWEPAMKDGKAVAMEYTLPIKFKLSGEPKKVEPVYTKCDQIEDAKLKAKCKEESKVILEENLEGLDSEIREDNTLALEQVIVYPNPAKESINIKFQAVAKPINLQIFTVDGKSVFQKSYPKFSGEFNELIDIKNVSTTLLLLKIEQEGKVFTEKIIVE